MLVAYCPLCGVVLQPVDRTTQPPGRNISWISEVRAVRSFGDTSSRFLTGVGYVSETSSLVAPLDKRTRYFDATQGLERLSFIHWASDEDWVFPFHEACWSLLQRRIADRKKDSARVAEHPFQILYCTPWPRYLTADCGHDYDGASKFQRAVDNSGYSASLPPEWSYLVADPRKSIDLTFLHTYLSNELSTTMLYFEKSISSDELSSLPDEVILLILTYLPSEDVCNLRSSSKKVAAISAPFQLPQSFWSSRFGKEFEMGFALAYESPINLEKHLDWRRLYFAFKDALQNHAQRGVRNRRRIWKALRNLSMPLDDIIANESNSQGEGYDEDTCLDQVSCSTVVAAELLRGNLTQEILRVGSKSLAIHHSRFPLSDITGEFNVGVSFIWFNGKSYVSGLRIWQTSEFDGRNKAHKAGLIVPSSERIVCFDGLNQLVGIGIALNVFGIIGLRFLVQNAAENDTYTTGDFSVTGPETGIAKLLKRRDTRLVAFRTESDVCRLVSIALIEQHSHRTDSRGQSFPLSQLNEQQRKMIGQIWSPEIPAQIDTIQSVPEKPNNQTFNLQLNMNFAGPENSSISSLQRIVALVGENASVFFGLHFVYDNKIDKFYGRCATRTPSGDELSCVESSFFIDGAAGERISAVRVGFKTSPHGIWSIELYTNMDRHTSFGLRHDDPDTSDTIHRPITLEPPSNSMITGFVATLDAIDGSFKTFGVQSKAFDSSESTSIHHARLSRPQKPSTKRMPPDEIYSFLGPNAVQTTASLSKVRCIRISSGANNRSRLSECISGLWLEYHDTERPCVVGQWINESGNFELSPGTELTEISIWSSIERKSLGGQPELGKIMALQFLLSSGQLWRFGQTDLVNALRLTFRANIFEKLDEISWTCSLRWDHAKVTYSPHHGLDDRPLRFNAYHMPSWVVPEKLFRQIRNCDGSLSGITSIQISSVPDGVTSLSFVYASGVSFILGSVDGEISSLELQDGEELSRLEVTFSSSLSFNPIVSLSLQTIHGRSITVSSQTYFEPPPPPPPPSPPPAAILLPQSLPLTSPASDNVSPPPLQTTSVGPASGPDCVFSLHRSEAVTQAAHKTNVYEFPQDAREYVGFWGIMGRRKRWLQNLGPIYR